MPTLTPLDKHYFDHSVHPPGDEYGFWSDRQSALARAQTVAEHYNLTIVEVVCGYARQVCVDQETNELASEREIRAASLPQAELKVTKIGQSQFWADITVEQRDTDGIYRYVTREHIDDLPSAQAACQAAGAFIEDYGGIGDRISYADDSLVGDCAALPTTVNVHIVLTEIGDEVWVRLVSADLDRSDWQYFDYRVETPSGSNSWFDRQSALVGAQTQADRYNLTIVEVIDEE